MCEVSGFILIVTLNFMIDNKVQRKFFFLLTRQEVIAKKLSIRRCVGNVWIDNQSRSQQMHFLRVHRVREITNIINEVLVVIVKAEERAILIDQRTFLLAQ